MDGSIGTEQRDLDGTDPEAPEVREGVVGQERPVGEDVHPAPLEPGV